MEKTKNPKINLFAFKISHEILRLVPVDLMERYHFVPFDLENEKLSIAIDDTEDNMVLDRIRISSGYELEVFHASKESIGEYLKTHIPEWKGSGEIKELQFEGLLEETPSEENSSAVSESGSAVSQAADKLFELAVQRGASDIHLEPQENNFFVRLRIDGILNSAHKFPKAVQPALSARIKILSNMDITEKRLPQDGQFSKNILNKNIDFRVSTLPGKYGEKIVIRILDKSGFSLDLSQLGFEPAMQTLFEEMIKRPQGMILVTGPTGSGKTTTLYSVLNRLRSPLKNVITLEDPIEYELLAGKSNESGITQVQINPKIGMTFASGLRASLRQDPDIIMIGEIRDRETAEIAMRSALTGHLVLSTLHTNDTFSTLIRLKDMGIEPYLISSTMIGILAQRLVRTLCVDCKESYRPPPRSLKILFPRHHGDLPKEIILYRSKGCERCQFSGYRGRKGIFELLMMTENLKQFIHSGDQSRNTDDMKATAVSKTLRESGLDLVKEGITTVEEVFRTTVE